MRNRLLFVALVVAYGAPAGAAVTFPADNQWVPFHCGAPVMTDPVGDDALFLNERDVVGDPADAAGYHASDATNLYLRIRLNADPAPAGALSASAWGYEFDLDGDPTTYELLVIVDGTGANAIVGVYANTATATANSPADPADAPALATFPFVQNARSIAAGSMLGGNGDFFLDFAVPWSTLVAHGVDHATSVRVWAGSSGAGNALTGDLACHDDTGGAGTLDGTVSAATPADPGSGSGSGGGGQGELVGGERCAVGGGGGLVVAFVVVFACRRRRRSR